MYFNVLNINFEKRKLKKLILLTDTETGIDFLPDKFHRAIQSQGVNHGNNIIYCPSRCPYTQGSIECSSSL